MAEPKNRKRHKLPDKVRTGGLINDHSLEDFEDFEADNQGVDFKVKDERPDPNFDAHLGPDRPGVE